jgi:hypothetical protein
LDQYVLALDGLLDLGVLRTGNVVGEYGEWLFARTFDWTLAPPSEKSHDATDASGIRFQIKARRDSGRGGTLQLGIMRNLSEDGWDKLAAIIFERDFEVRKAVIAPRDVIAEQAVYSGHQRGHLIHLNAQLSGNRRVLDVTERLRKFHANQH